MLAQWLDTNKKILGWLISIEMSWHNRLKKVTSSEKRKFLIAPVLLWFELIFHRWIAILHSSSYFLISVRLTVAVTLTPNCSSFSCRKTTSSAPKSRSTLRQSLIDRKTYIHDLPTWIDLPSRHLQSKIRVLPLSLVHITKSSIASASERLSSDLLGFIYPNRQSTTRRSHGKG